MGAPFLQIRDLTKVYYKNRKPVKRALKEASLDLYAGEIFGLLGVNGAGKTTLVSILASLHPPTAGDVLWQGKTIYDQLLSYREIIGYCPQRPNVENKLSLEELLLISGRCFGLSKDEAEERKSELVKQFDLSSYAQGYINQLSGGYRQRFLIARALMHRPKLLILDEPTVGLDPHIRRALWETIRELKRDGMTVLLTTHYLDEAETLSDRVCLLHQGRVRVVDTPQNLMSAHQKETLEQVFLKFVDDPDSELFTAREETHD